MGRQGLTVALYITEETLRARYRFSLLSCMSLDQRVYAMAYEQRIFIARWAVTA